MQALFKKKSLFYFVIILLVLITSKTYAVENNTQKSSSLDIQQVQTRVYEASYSDVYKSVISVLQDNRFKITHSDKDSGIVSADGTPEASENMSNAVAAIGDFVIPFFSLFQNKQEKKWFVSTSIEELKQNKIKVIISITEEKKKTGFFVKAKKSSKADDLTKSQAAVYQALFAKIDKNLFLRKQLQN